MGSGGGHLRVCLSHPCSALRDTRARTWFCICLNPQGLGDDYNMSHWTELCGSNKQNPRLPKPKAEISRALWCPCAPCAVSVLGTAVHSFQFSSSDEEFLSSPRLTWSTTHTARSARESPNGSFTGTVYSSSLSAEGELSSPSFPSSSARWTHF